MFKEIRRRKAARRVKAGNGRPLKDFRWWQQLSRALFYLTLTNDAGRQAVFAVDVPYWQKFSLQMTIKERPTYTSMANITPSLSSLPPSPWLEERSR